MRDYGRAFVEGASIGGRLLFVFPVGELAMPSGAIIACDPLVAPETRPLTRRVPVGRYPVLLSVAHVSGTDQRVAFAMLRVSETPVARWEPAFLPGDDVSVLGEDEFFGYGVDAGVGCFMDAQAGEALVAAMERLGPSQNYYTDALAAELQPNSRSTWTWCLHRPVAGEALNVAVFSSGWGDGVYGSTFGIDARGDVVCLVTDFQVVDLVRG